MDLEVMAMKGYTTLPISLELKPDNQIHFDIVPRKSFF